MMNNTSSEELFLKGLERYFNIGCSLEGDIRLLKGDLLLYCPAGWEEALEALGYGIDGEYEFIRRLECYIDWEYAEDRGGYGMEVIRILDASFSGVEIPAEWYVERSMDNPFRAAGSWQIWLEYMYSNCSRYNIGVSDP
ncbi:MAG: hypothetical protein K5770_12485 [Lachnospiraceae bacterium]|nr:hypothetical protein [Lachnospiraceae bacterium]